MVNYPGQEGGSSPCLLVSLQRTLKGLSSNHSLNLYGNLVVSSAENILPLENNTLKSMKAKDSRMGNTKGFTGSDAGVWRQDFGPNDHHPLVLHL